MRVTLVASMAAPLADAEVGGAQSMVGELARGLAAAGVDVEVVGAPGSRVRGVALWCPRHGPYPKTLLHPGPSGAGAPTGGRGGADASAVLAMTQMPAWVEVTEHLAGRGGVVHGHAMDRLAFAMPATLGLPVIHTLHLPPLDAAATAGAVSAASRAGGARFAAPSRSLAAAWEPLLRVDTVLPNGVDPAAFPAGDGGERDLAVVAGRVSPEKGTHVGVIAALAAGMRVAVVGAVYDAAYHAAEVEPLLDGIRARYLGHVPRDRLAGILGRAAVAVQASQWDEPFGLGVVEAAMTGTPVAVTPRGALPDVVARGLGVVATGTDAPALAAAIAAARRLDRRTVRAAAVARHGIHGAVRRHLGVYARLAEQRSGRPAT